MYLLIAIYCGVLKSLNSSCVAKQHPKARSNSLKPVKFVFNLIGNVIGLFSDNA